MDEMEVELEINVVDPIGDAAMLLNINPDNMLPLICLMVLYISYGTLMHMSRSAQVTNRDPPPPAVAHGQYSGF